MRLRLMLLFLAAVFLAGCGFVDVPDAKSTTGRAPTVAEVPSPDETVRGPEDPPIVTLELGNHLKERKLSRTEDLPSGIIVPTTNLNAVPITTALQAVLAGTDVSLSWDSSSFDDRLVTVTNLSGPLPHVVHKMCASAKVFCNYKNGLLEIKEKETFIVELPAVPSLKASASSGSGSNSMADMIGELAGDKARIDQQGGNLLYTTDVSGQENVKEYLFQLRHGRPLVVMQLYIWEVTLNKDRGAGINWSEFSMPKIGGNYENLSITNLASSFSSLTTPGVSLGAKLSGKVSADTVLEFLSKQGQVQTISNPQLTFVSGANAEFRVGGTQHYISQVGQLTSVSSSTSSSGVGTNTISTDTLDTGLTVMVGGAFESGVISAVMEIGMEDVVSLNPTTMESGVIVDLPETSERKVSTSLRVRPGDNLVLAGLVSSRDANDREGVPLPFGKKLSTYAKDQIKNSEIVILVKPSVVLFADAPEEEQRKPPRKASQGAMPSLPDAVMIDKDGARSVAVPDPFIQPVSTDPLLLPSLGAVGKPELMVSETVAAQAPLSSIPIAPSADGAPVDKRLLQRGFSHAFDEMLTPPLLATSPNVGEGP